MTRVTTTRGLRLAAILAAVAALATTAPAMAQDKDPHSHQGCATCHTPHNAATAADFTAEGLDDSSLSVPLWAITVPVRDGVDGDGEDIWVTEKRLTSNVGIDLTTYDSASMDATDAGQTLTGASLLCVSCHDGTHGGNGRAFGTGNGMGALSHAHPMGIDYANAAAADSDLVDAATVAAEGALDNTGKVGCTSCHDVHISRETDVHGGENYLRWAYLENSYYVYGQGSIGESHSYDFCTHCHIK